LSEQNKEMLHDAVCFLGAGISTATSGDRWRSDLTGRVLDRLHAISARVESRLLQTIYEFQSMVAELFGMDVANASMYDGGDAMAEAAILAYGANGRKKIVVSAAVHPHYREVLKTYGWSTSLDIETIALEWSDRGLLRSRW